MRSKFRCLKGEPTKDMREKKLSNKKVCANVCLLENNMNINLNINIKINNSNKLKSVSFSFFFSSVFFFTDKKAFLMTHVNDGF